MSFSISSRSDPFKVDGLIQRLCSNPGQVMGGGQSLDRTELKIKNNHLKIASNNQCHLQTSALAIGRNRFGETVR